MIQGLARAAVVLLLCGRALAQEPSRLSSLSQEQIKREIESLESEIEKLSTSADAPDEWKELQQVEEKIFEARRKHWHEIDPLRWRSFELSQSPKVSKWQERIDKLGQRLGELQTADRRLTRDAGIRLFEARHAELARQAPATPKLHQVGFTVLNYPRIDGSTSTQPLAALITCRCFDAPFSWVGRGQSRPRPQDEEEPSPFERLLGEAKPEPEALLSEFTLQAKSDAGGSGRLAAIINQLLATNASTHQAYVNLIEGRSDIGLLARRPSSDELEWARTKSVELDVTHCALDAFVFLVNRDNPIRNLTTEQIRDIYSGKVKGWKDVGGTQDAITAYQREENSGSQQLMKELVMKGVPLHKSAGEFEFAPQLIGRLMISTFLELTSDPSGIGYSVYYYERFMSGSPRTCTIAVDGVEPNPETIATRKYPFVSEVFVVTRKESGEDSSAAKLRGWLLSQEGQDVVASSGYVPIPRIID